MPDQRNPTKYIDFYAGGKNGGHHSRPQTFFKSSNYARISRLYKIKTMKADREINRDQVHQ